MNFKDNTTLGKITLGISLLILVYMIGITVSDFIIGPIYFDNPNSKILILDQYLRRYSKIFLLCIGDLACINFVLGIIALSNKNSNKKLTIISLIICSPFIIAFIIGNLQGFMIISGI